MSYQILPRIIAKIAASYTEKTYNSRLLDRDQVRKIDPASLLFYYGDIHSQCGQDGILAEIFRRLKISTGLFVEFGAWDGRYLSNSRHLYEKGWKGVYIEGRRRRYKTLLEGYPTKDITCIHAMVGAPAHGVAGAPLHELLASHNIGHEEVTFVSIDVDGPDLEIFLEMGFRPPVVLLEGGFNFSPHFTVKIPPEAAWRCLQQSLPVIFSAIDETGYVPVCFYQDTYLIREDLAAPFRTWDVVKQYTDAFHFMPAGFRKSLLALRRESAQVRGYERDFFGCFSEDPLSYALQT